MAQEQKGELDIDKQDFLDLCNMIEGTLDEATGVGYVIYMWSVPLDCGKGAASKNADSGDALVALARIAKGFKINPDALAVALKEEYKNGKHDIDSKET